MKQLTVFVHAHLQAFFQSACLTLIAVCFIYDASASARLTPEIRRDEHCILVDLVIDHSDTANLHFRHPERSKRFNQS